jgi:hypothetical protein
VPFEPLDEVAGRRLLEALPEVEREVSLEARGETGSAAARSPRGASAGRSGVWRRLAPRASVARVIFALSLGFLLPMSAPNRFMGASQSDERSPEMMKMRAIAAVAASVGAVASGASAQEAVQWRVEDGGNGHWYRRFDEAGVPWATARDRAFARGGYLATLSSFEENSFTSRFFPGIPAGPGYWFGGVKVDGQWSWVTGEPWEFASWGSTAEGCNNQPDGRDATDIYCIDSGGQPRWSDDFFDWPNAVGYLVEWSADCNADGVVDYGQILAGDLVDANGNHIPDCCEEGLPCAACAAADLIPNGQIDGVDLALLISAWGTDGGKFPETDIDRDGIVAGSDLALLLSYWGPCD